MKIYTIPIPSTSTDSNYFKSLVTGFDISEIKKLATSSDIFSKLSTKNKIHLWGIRGHSKSIFNRIVKGDYILFYNEGCIISYCNLTEKFIDKKLANQLWSPLSQNLPSPDSYENILIVSPLQKVNIDYSILIKYAGYSSKASVRRFYMYSEAGLKNILSEYSSINTFLLSYKE